jgi:PST family polysaccharide transporter
MSEGGGLGRRFLVGTAQLGIGTTAVSMLNLVVGVLLARWLGPEQFGLFAFVFGISELLGIVGAVSLGAGLIQAREATRELYDTASVILGGLGLVALLVAVLLAPWLSHMRGSEAAWFLIVLGLSRVLRLVSQVPRARLERSLRYGRITTLSVIETGVPSLTALALAFFGMGAWALVVREVLVSTLTFVLESAASGHRLRLRAHRAESRQLMDFARPMFVARSIDILVERVDRVAVGSFLGNTPAGLLDRGRFLADIGLYVMRPIERTALNLLSRLQDDPARLSRAYEIIHYFLVRLMFLGAIVLVLTPVETLRLVLGEEWVGAAPALRLLGLHAAVHPIYSLIKVLVIARNRVARIARISVVQAAILIPGTSCAAWLGSLAGVAGVVALSTWTGALLGVLASRDLAALSYRRSLGVPLGVATATAVLLLALDELVGPAAMPWAVRPFAVAAAFGLGVLALEHRMLLAELRYLRAQLTRSAP